jgi:hypothetical protein
MYISDILYACLVVDNLYDGINVYTYFYFTYYYAVVWGRFVFAFCIFVR